MKKTKILAFSVVFATAILAVWFTGERTDSDEQATPSVADVQPPSPPISDETEPAPAIERTERPVETPPLPVVSSTEPVRLFSSQISEFGVEYANARTEVATRFNNSPELQLLRSTVVELNREGIERFLAVSQFAPNSFGQPPLQLPSKVDLTLFPDAPCTIGEVTYANNVTGVWSLRANCVEDRYTEVSIVIDSQSEKFSITQLNTGSHPNRDHQLVSLESSPYALALEFDPQTRPRVRTGL